MKEDVIIVGIIDKSRKDSRFDASIEELRALVDTAGGTVVELFTQERYSPHRSTYLGKGKIEELYEKAEELNVDTIIFNDELSSSQVKHLTDELDRKVMDRTQLILDIFARRARTKEGIIQVELAQMSYLLPRLSGQGQMMSRLGGGIGTRGPGETKLETDRRHIQKRMDDLKSQLKEMISHREGYRKQRKNNYAIQYALVGYTNAGKSTIINKLTQADTMEKDELFATLDPLTRKMDIPSGLSVLITDTVGFIEDLPTTLIAAFRSTLEEVKEADVLLHVVDASHPDCHQHMKTVDKLLTELDAGAIPVLTIYNKIDQVTDTELLTGENSPSIRISARDDADIERLREAMEDVLKEQMQFHKIRIPMWEGKDLSSLYESTILKKETLIEKENMLVWEGFAPIDHPVNGIIKKYKTTE
ncbi:GTP-binding protein HflX [Sinobaca qinghaiensis]|uniref:GTPase HflX n=1 Tax=Sinobaca qinghaiensis TaxID=342944 RepID=A0A419V5Q4_9BACL|nr:GTPase HflX [Sinobaca qinghaiensis]RKD75300.1 GTP-binding protein HflX [Sinobaca qinghaiensis]